jgi:hypothetical protein
MTEPIKDTGQELVIPKDQGIEKPRKRLIPSGPNAIDLIDLATCKQYIGLQATNTDADGIIQFLITSFSQYALNCTGRDSFTSIEHYIEIYNGNGAQRMFLRNTPIVVVNSLIVGNYAMSQSQGLTSFGWYIEQTGKSIGLRGVISQFTPYTLQALNTNIGPYITTMPMKFPMGMGNIQVDYNAGYASVPWDLQEAAMKVVAQNYKRKDWVDQASKSLSAGSGMIGTTRYRDWAMPPEVENVLVFYKRRALV